MSLQLLYETETIVDELATIKMPKKQQRRVAKIRHCLGVVSACFEHGISRTNDQLRCHKALVKIRTLCELGSADARSKQVRERFTDLLQRVAHMESWVKHEIESPGIITRLKGLVKIFLSWIL